MLIFSNPLVVTYVMSAQKNRLNETGLNESGLNETVLLSTHNMCFG